jgi:hypothetical protein
MIKLPGEINTKERSGKSVVVVDEIIGSSGDGKATAGSGSQEIAIP